MMSRVPTGDRVARGGPWLPPTLHQLIACSPSMARHAPGRGVREGGAGA
jgi:hypothetical protein